MQPKRFWKQRTVVRVASLVIAHHSNEYFCGAHPGTACSGSANLSAPAALCGRLEGKAALCMWQERAGRPCRRTSSGRTWTRRWRCSTARALWLLTGQKVLWRRLLRSCCRPPMPTSPRLTSSGASGACCRCALTRICEGLIYPRRRKSHAELATPSLLACAVLCCVRRVF